MLPGIDPVTLAKDVSVTTAPDGTLNATLGFFTDSKVAWKHFREAGFSGWVGAGLRSDYGFVGYLPSALISNVISCRTRDSLILIFSPEESALVATKNSPTFRTARPSTFWMKSFARIPIL